MPQVSNKQRLAFKSDSLCLVVLPCSEVLCECVAGCFDSFCLLVLLLSGDVETNPGPTLSVSDQLETIIENQKVSAIELKSIRENLDGHISDSNRRLASTEEKIESFTQTIKRVEECESTVLELREQIASLCSKVDDLEYRSRRNNLIIFGIKEDGAETPKSLRDAVLTEVFEEKLGITVGSVERIHRFGRQLQDKDRPVVMRFFDFNEKMNLLRNAKKLKGSGMSLSEDYPFRIQNNIAMRQSDTWRWSRDSA
ncbi:uncharacterized protein LOC144123721 [Amblyomma americanum]